jgi:DNA transposition AAA+ family ATPase
MVQINDTEDVLARASVEEKLLQVAAEIRLWQDGQSPRVSDNSLLQMYPALGSTKTYKKLREGDFTQLDVADWLPRYEGVITQIRLVAENQVEDIYDDLSGPSEIYRTILQLLQCRGLNRLVLVEGSSGSGKTQALKLVQRKLVGSVVYIEADETWKKPWQATGQLCLALGAVKKIEELPSSLGDRMNLIKANLQQRKLIQIDEAQHMGGETLNIFKTFLNHTPSLFVFGTMDTLWRKLQASSWEEAKQLIFNRMFARIRLTGPTLEDTQMFFERRLNITTKKDTGLEKACQAIATTAKTYGGLAYLRNVAERCKQLGATDVDGPTLLQAAKHVKEQVEGR